MHSVVVRRQNALDRTSAKSSEILDPVVSARKSWVRPKAQLQCLLQTHEVSFGLRHNGDPAVRCFIQPIQCTDPELQRIEPPSTDHFAVRIPDDVRDMSQRRVKLRVFDVLAYPRALAADQTNKERDGSQKSIARILVS